MLNIMADTTDRYKLLCDFGELSWIFSHSQDIESFLNEIVRLVSRHMLADACSIFLWETESEELVMRATIGLSPKSIGRVRLKAGEGLAGLALKESRPISVREASKHPQFKFFPDINEENYDAFLAVPILRGIEKIGVLTVRRSRKNPFEEENVQALRVIATQLANIIENARLLMQLGSKVREKPQEKALTLEGPKLFRGTSASGGFAVGEVLILARERSIARMSEAGLDSKHTLADFRNALEETATQLEELQGRVEEKLDDAASLIFSAHLLLLKDQELIKEVVRLIAEGQTPARALIQVAKKYIEIFSQSSNTYARDKGNDLEDLTLRILGNLDSSSREHISVKDKIVIARNLFPSDVLKLSAEEAAGIILVSGGATSHTSILCRSLKLPLVIIDEPALLNLSEETRILVDADRGVVCVNPKPEEITECERRFEDLTTKGVATPVSGRAVYTLDGVRIRLLANINLVSDLAPALAANVDGIGLYRTEYPFLIRSDFPSEEEQYMLYQRVIDKAGDREITIRTLDVGGDKVLSYYQNYQEANPFLGLRSIRFALKNEEVFREQVRAILRTCTSKKVRIMFPMISSLDEFRHAKEILLQCRDELLKEGKKIELPQIGMMVELPSLLDIMDGLARETDFFSIGTNDLIQYLLGVDRSNEKVAEFYLPHHPAVLRALDRVVSSARRNHKEVSVCGDMAHQTRYISFLLGIGIRDLSMDVSYLPAVRHFISQISMAAAEELARSLLSKDSISEISSILEPA